MNLRTATSDCLANAHIHRHSYCFNDDCLAGRSPAFVKMKGTKWGATRAETSMLKQCAVDECVYLPDNFPRTNSQWDYKWCYQEYFQRIVASVSPYGATNLNLMSGIDSELLTFMKGFQVFLFKGSVRQEQRIKNHRVKEVMQAEYALWGKIGFLEFIFGKRKKKSRHPCTLHVVLKCLRSSVWLEKNTN